MIDVLPLHLIVCILLLNDCCCDLNIFLSLVFKQVLGLSLDEEEDGLVTDDKTISDQDKSTLIKLYTDLFMDYAKLILGVYRY